jgi:prepilin-type N-terminal cleavage/methylation domain-containing protein
MKRENASGYSLIEVLIAVAITGFVLLTVVTLFYMGRRNVYSGKEMTYAVSVATRMLEDISSMTSTDLASNFGINDGTTFGNVTVGDTTYANSVGRDTTSAGNATLDPQGFLTNWKNMIDGSKLAGATAGLVVTPRLPLVGNQPVTTAQTMKVRVWVQWNEGSRRRTAFFDTTRFNH